MATDRAPPKTLRRSPRHKQHRSRRHLVLKQDFSKRPQTANTTSGSFPLSPSEQAGTQSDPEDFAEEHIVIPQLEYIPEFPEDDMSPRTMANGHRYHSLRRESRTSARGSDRRARKARTYKKRASNRTSRAQPEERTWGPRAADEPVPTGPGHEYPPMELESLIMESLEKSYNFAIPPNASPNADSLILFKTSAHPTERLHALITAMHAELFLAMSFVDQDPENEDEIDPVTNRWKEVVMQDLLVEIMPRVGGFLKELGYEMGLAFKRSGAGVKVFDRNVESR
ncbi:hypothetical protein MBLNU457_3425t1 [Dothideomycetes sp. NU457]